MSQIRVLGTLAVHLPDGSALPVALTQPKLVALLLYLALAEPTGPQSRETLMALLWPDADTDSARHSLRNALYRLRQTLGEGAIVSRGEGYVGLDPATLRCDALEVRRLLAAQRWEEAVAMGAELAPGFHVSEAPEFERWLDNQRASLLRAVTDAAWRRVDELERSGEPGLVAAAQRAWALEPANEAGARRLMRFLDASVGRAAALRAYEDLVAYLQRECETEPSAETRVLAGDLKSRIEPRVQSIREAAPAAGQSPELQVGTPAVPSGFPAAPRRISAGTAALAGAIIMVGLVSLFALRPGRSARANAASPDLGDPIAMAESRGILRLAPKYRQDTSAYASYLRALDLRFTAPLSESRDTFEALVKRQPLYAPGLAGLAHAYALSTLFAELPPAEGWAKVEAAAHKAIALDSTLASAYLALGAMEICWHWNSSRARELLDRGIALEPTDPEGYAVLGVWFRWQADMDSVVIEARKSLELDPLNPQWTVRLARQLSIARRYDEAEAMYRRAMRDDPPKGYYSQMAGIYRAKGRMKDALDMLRTERAERGDSEGLADFPRASSDSEAARVFADWDRRDLRQLEEGKRKGEWIPPGDFAFAYAHLKDKDETLRWLDSMTAARDPGLQFIRVSAGFDFLRGDPRYLAWEAKMPWRRDR